VNEYILGAPSGHSIGPAHWWFQGSQNGVDWDTLDTQELGVYFVRGSGDIFSYSFANTTAYRFYRLAVTQSKMSNGGDYAQFAIGSMQLIGPIKQIPQFT
jgi:alpha-L-fucosidase 2